VYQLLVYLHILGGVLWVGGAVYGQVLAISVNRASDPTDLPRMVGHIEAVATRVFVPASLLVIITGVVMTLQAWSFGQLWIAVAVALWVLSAAAGLYVGPGIKRTRELFDAEGPESAAARALLQRLFLVSRLELLSFAVIIALMVFKPGA
jgi:uncharacterized membrane protein